MPFLSDSLASAYDVFSPLLHKEVTLPQLSKNPLQSSSFPRWLPIVFLQKGWSWLLVTASSYPIHCWITFLNFLLHPFITAYPPRTFRRHSWHLMFHHIAFYHLTFFTSHFFCSNLLTHWFLGHKTLLFIFLLLNRPAFFVSIWYSVHWFLSGLGRFYQLICLLCFIFKYCSHHPLGSLLLF